RRFRQRLAQRAAEHLACDRLQQRLSWLRIDGVTADGHTRAIAERAEVERPDRAAVVAEYPGLAADREVPRGAHRIDVGIRPRYEGRRGAAGSLVAGVGDQRQAVRSVAAR